MKVMSKTWWEVCLIGLIIILFTLLRVYNIDQSFFFFGDVGRDFYTLQKWQETGKPPLLGPQTSAVPFNQSAVYFYVLYPFYLLYQQSVFSSFIATYLIYIFVFVAGIILLRREPTLRRVWLIAWLLLSLQPQMVLQHRYIWNPSFVAASLMSSFIFWRLYIQYSKIWQLVGWAFTAALATAFSYSALPVVAAYGLITLWKYRSRFLPFLIVTGVSLGLVNSGTLAFEVRHQFALTKLLIFGEKLPQAANTWVDKLSSLHTFVLAAPTSGLALIVMTLVIAALGWHIWQARQKKVVIDSLQYDTWFLALFTSILTLLLPVSLFAHYVFGLITCGILVIATLPLRWAIGLTLVLAIIWLRPTQLNHYFQPVFRPPLVTEACAAYICSQLTQSVFVSVQPGYEPHHNHSGLEFRFLLKKAGCQVFDVETQPGLANHMVVFADNSIYEHGKTAYNELTQFGPATEIQQISCPTTPITVHLLQRVDQ